MGKIEEAQHILKQLGLPVRQQNELAALTLLALTAMAEDGAWNEASMQALTLPGILKSIKDIHGKEFPEEAQSMVWHDLNDHFVPARVVERNPYDPNTVRKSRYTNYGVTDELLKLLRLYQTDGWDSGLQKFAMGSSGTPASPKGSCQQLRAEFANLNPHLREDASQYHCRPLWHLLTAKHRHGLPICYPASPLAWESECFLRNSEVWKDTLTGLPVIALHLDCKHSGGAGVHDGSLQVLAKSGLWYVTSKASWVHERARLVVIARADVLERISFPHLPDGNSDVDECSLSKTPPPEINWEMCYRVRLAEERAVRDRQASLAFEAWSRGDYQAALELYCETASIDRTGGFHQSAWAQLAHAEGVICSYPGLEVRRLRFENGLDREYIVTKHLLRNARRALERRLEGIAVPAEWRPFIVSEPWDACARISGHGRSGYARIQQESDRSQWSATVALTGGPCISTAADTGAHAWVSSDNFCCHSPEAAVEEAIKIYYDYGKRLIEAGIPLPEIIRLSGVLGETQSSE